MSKIFSVVPVQDGDDLVLPLPNELLEAVKWKIGDTLRFRETEEGLILERVFYREQIILNKAKCKICEDEVESIGRHSFVKCKCGEIFVDGGKSYLRHGANNFDNFIDLSVVEQIERSPYDWEKL